MKVRVGGSAALGSSGSTAGCAVDGCWVEGLVESGGGRAWWGTFGSIRRGGAHALCPIEIIIACLFQFMTDRNIICRCKDGKLMSFGKAFGLIFRSS